MRQADVITEYDPKPGVSIATLAYEYPSRYQVPEHAHGSDQLIYAISGLMEVSSGQSMWLIPPQFALWIPARTHHRIHMPGPVSMRTLYLRPHLAARAEPHCAVLHVTPLLRELIVETVRVNRLRASNRYETALRDLLVAQLQQASPMPTFITLPRDERARAVAQAILRNPAESRTIALLCTQTGVSVRTIQRIFRIEIGASFETWRRQARLTRAIELLVSGASIKEVSYRVGYRQPGAFVEAFRQTFGTTPKAWVATILSASPGASPSTAMPTTDSLQPALTKP